MDVRGYRLLLGLFVLLILFTGCGKNPDHPLEPDFNSQNPLTSLTSTVSGHNYGSHQVLGYYQLSLSGDSEFEITPLRSTDIHVNVTNILFPPKCLDCFLAELIAIDGELWTFKFTIRNPTFITGYDVRVTILDLGNILIHDPTSYTQTFALPDDPNPINPFVVFDTGNGQNEWQPEAQADTNVTFLRPDGSKFNQIIFVVDGSYPDNQEDPYVITGINAEPPYVHLNGSDTTNIAATVYDWQSNVNFVTIDLTPLGGSGTTEMTNLLGNLWILEDVSYLDGGAGAGTHYLKITASSVGQETYNYIPITVLD